MNYGTGMVNYLNNQGNASAYASQEGNPYSASYIAGITDQFGNPTGLHKQSTWDYVNNNSASIIRSRIARDEWEDYKVRFQPLEDMLVDYAKNPGSFSEPLKETALGRVNQQYDSLGGMQTRRLESYGLNVPQEQRAEMDRRNELDRSLAKVGTENMVNQFSKDQLYDIIGGGLNYPSNRPTGRG